MPAKVILEIQTGPIAGKVFAFDGHDTFMFGRASDCHAHLPDDVAVSRHHFLLEANPPDVRVRDLGSLNGTFVNQVKYGGRAAGETPQQARGRQYPQVDLKHGDTITVGHTTIGVQVQLPPSCARCGAELSIVAATGNELCSDCAKQPNIAQRTMVEVLRCDRCGGDVSAEVLNGRRGYYMCQRCRDDMMADSNGLKRLLQNAPKRQSGGDLPQIEGYEIGKVIGRGGMGVVYQAVERDSGQQVAIKMMLAKVAVSPVDRMKFLREIDVGSRLLHPNIVTPMKSGATGSMFFFVMEYCDGGSLDGLMAQHGGRLPLPAAAPLMMQALSGLEHAHRQNVIHRDLKPQNVLLSRQDNQMMAKITDFGLAKNFEMAGLSGMTATGSFAGTLPFTPREQLTNYKYIDPTSDVWSIAATFYHLLSGQFPLDFPANRDPVEVILHDDPVPLRRRHAELPAAICKVLDGALLTNPKKRYANAAELKAALKKAL